MKCLLLMYNTGLERVLEYLMRQWGMHHDLTFVSDEPELFAVLEEACFDVVLIHHNSPTSYQAIYRVLRHADFAHRMWPIILFTPSHTDFYALHPQDIVLIKPFGAPELHTIFRQLQTSPQDGSAQEEE